MILSICIVTLYKRAGMLSRLLRELYQQIQDNSAEDKVEVLVQVDEGEMTTGAKSNLLYNQARGKYVCRIDDDDWVYPWYIKEILKAAGEDPDAMATNGIMTTDGRNERRWFISKDLPYTESRDRHGRVIYLRYHNHLSPIRRTIALQYPFPDLVMYEDAAFAKALHQARAIKTEVVIGTSWALFMSSKAVACELPMYHYRFSTKK